MVFVLINNTNSEVSSLTKNIQPKKVDHSLVSECIGSYGETSTENKIQVGLVPK